MGCDALLPHLDHIELGDAILLHTHGHGDAVLLNEHDESWLREGKEELGRRLTSKWGSEGQKGEGWGEGRGERKESWCSYVHLVKSPAEIRIDRSCREEKR